MQRRDMVLLGTGLALGTILGVCATIGANAMMQGSILPDCRQQTVECAARTAELREKADAYAAQLAAMEGQLAALQKTVQKLDTLSKQLEEPDSKGKYAR